MNLKRWVCGLLLMVFLLGGPGGSQADPDLRLQDASLRSGSWADAYAVILAERSADIQAYQDYVLGITSLSSCQPVDLLDLTGDGIPELLFLDLVEETEYGFKTGRFWIYTADSSGIHCVLTLQPEIDDLLYSRYYLAKTGLLTIHFSDCEMGWILQLRPDLSGRYAAETTLIEQEDFSGEGPDAYFRNGQKISAKKYRSLTAEIQADQGSMIGSLMVDDGGTGFTYTLTEALQALSSEKLSAPPDTGSDEENDINSFPELAFSKGSFTAGQRFEVYSAPSARSWRGARGKAAITSGSEIFVAGTENDWILILYELDSGVVRAGYIDSRKINGPHTVGDVLSFSPVRMQLIESAVMTDDPIRQKATIGKLKKGTQVTCLAKYRGMIYVEAKVSGKTARGFIVPSSLGLEN